jgi:hypothetical protein
MRKPETRGGVLRHAKDTVRQRIADVVSTEYPAPFTVPVQQIWGHCYTTASETRAVYLLRDARWANQTAGTQAQTRDLQTAAWASLVGRHVRIRVADLPVNPDPWAVRHIRSAPNPAGVDGADLHDHVLAGALRQREPWMRDVIVTVDVRLCGADNGDPDDSWEEQEAEVFVRLSGDGLHAVRGPGGLVDWMIRTSVAPGHLIPRPGLARPAEVMAEYVEEVDWTAPPGPRMVRIGKVGEADQWAVALTVSTMQERPCPGGPPPWMSAVLGFPFPVQLVVAGSIESASEAAPKFEKRARWQKDQITHQVKVGVEPDESTIETFGDARRLADRLKTGDGVVALADWVGRLVVTGPSPKVAADRARAVIKTFDVEQHITLAWERDQVTAIRELIPGVREISRGYHRYSDVALWSTGMPNVTGRVGQQTGMHVGYTSGRMRGRPVRFDPWYPPEVLNRAAIYPVLGDPGAGRSTLGLRAIQECILLGIPVVAIDPAGEWTNVDQLPGGAGRVQTIDLSGRTAGMAGLLALDQLIPDPDPADYTDDDGVVDMVELRSAQEDARKQRVTAAIDAMRAIFDDDTWANEVRREAIKDSAWDCDGNLWRAIDWLDRPEDRGGSEANRRLARELTAAAHGSARLLFPPRDRAEAATQAGALGVFRGRGLFDAQVTIITMQGMEFPRPGSDQRHWTSAERHAALIMRLTAHFGRRLIKEHDRRSRRCRKLLLVDEASWLANWEHGVAWISSFVRHARRWNCPMMLMSQHPRDLARLDPEGKTFSSGGFIGQHDKAEPATDSLALTGAPPGLEAVVTGLSLVPREDEDDPGRVPGEFLFTDADRWTERIRVDLDPYPVLTDVAYTSPGERPGGPVVFETAGADTSDQAAM